MKKAAPTVRQFTALNMVYLLVAITGLLAFLYAAMLPGEPPPANDTQDLHGQLRQSRLVILMLVSILELGLGIYIQQSAQKVALFIQSLSFMLLLAGHVLFVYAFFDRTPNGADIQRVAAWICGISLFLQLSVLAARLPFQVKIVMRKD